MTPGERSGSRWIIATSDVLHSRRDCPALKSAQVRNGDWKPYEVPAGHGGLPPCGTCGFGRDARPK